MNAGLPAFQKMFNPQLAFVVGSGGVSIEDFHRQTWQSFSEPFYKKERHLCLYNEPARE